MNVQGEAVQKLDAYSNDVLVNVLERSGHCGIIGSEELEGAKTAGHPGKYIVLFDPLDGSSNIDLNVSIGTIFAVLRRQDPTSPPSVNEALRPGRDVIAAGYALYGPSTVLVLSTGQGVHVLHDGPERRRVLPLTVERAMPRQRRALLGERRQPRALDGRRPEMERVDQSRVERRQAVRTDIATSALSSRTRTARS